ncbi:MAG TPA: hypothetical protein VGK89_01950 [Candidatus Eisenbacteria bacterium]
MILVFTGLCMLLSLVVLALEFKRLSVLSRFLLGLQLLMFCLVFVSWLGISF